MVSQPTLRYRVVPGTPLRIELDGEIDYAARADLAATLALVTAADPADITVDLAGVSYLASEGLAFLVGLNNQVAPGHRVTLASPQPIVARVLQISGFASVFSVEPIAA
jgi:anti-anti-sigma factor